jgi:hypothetical protein
VKNQKEGGVAADGRFILSLSSPFDINTKGELSSN